MPLFLLLQAFALLFLQLSPLVSCVLLPNLTGPYPVGTISVELLDSKTSRDLMVSIFYPTASTCTSYNLTADFPSLTLAYEIQAVGLALPPGVPPPAITTQSHLGAPLLSTSFPLLLFSPGYGSSRLLYTAAAEDIASMGYIVTTIDHPNDTAFIEYPDGRVATSTPITTLAYDAYIPFVDARVSDLRFVLDSFSNSSFIAQIPGAEKSRDHEGKPKENCFDTSRVGILGHSLGGAAAGATMLADRRFSCGANLDGAMIGNVTSLGLSSPFMIMAAHGHNLTDDPTWAEFWPKLRGWKRLIEVNGTLHHSYSDLLVLADDLIEFLPPSVFTDEVGTIDGMRMLRIESAYLGDFFDKWLKGKRGELLDGPNKLFPEVTFDDY